MSCKKEAEDESLVRREPTSAREPAGPLFFIPLYPLSVCGMTGNCRKTGRGGMRRQVEDGRLRLVKFDAVSAVSSPSCGIRQEHGSGELSEGRRGHVPREVSFLREVDHARRVSVRLGCLHFSGLWMICSSCCCRALWRRIGEPCVLRRQRRGETLPHGELPEVVRDGT